MNVGELWNLAVGAVLARIYKLLSLSRLRPNINRVIHHVWIGGRNHPLFIVGNGFNCVVDLRQKNDSKYCSYLKKSGIEYLKKPTPDGFGMPPSDLLDILEWIDIRARTGAKVLIHCDLGRGRAALVVASYLVYAGIDSETALKLVKEKRKITYLNRRQMHALRAFAQTLSSSRKAKALN